MSNLPAWAIDGLRDAGVSAEGWEPHDLPDWVVWNREPHRFEVCERGEWLDILGPDGESVAFEVESVPDAFLLAARLAAALENKPDPRVVELEAEVARLRGEIDRMGNRLKSQAERHELETKVIKAQNDEMFQVISRVHRNNIPGAMIAKQEAPNGE